MNPEPYTDWLCIEPVTDVNVLSNTLRNYGLVISKGPDAKGTEVGQYVAYEQWDKPIVPIKDKEYHFVREQDAIAKIPESLIV